MSNAVNKINRALIQAEVDPSLKEAFKAWWQSHGFASEAEAVRYHIRKITDFDSICQEKLCPN